MKDALHGASQAPPLTRWTPHPPPPATHQVSTRKTTHSTAKMISTAAEPLFGSDRFDHPMPSVF